MLGPKQKEERNESKKGKAGCNLSALEVRRMRTEEATGNFDGAGKCKMQDDIHNQQDKAHGSNALQKIHIADAINTNVPALF